MPVAARNYFSLLARTIPDAHFVWVGGRPEDIEFWRQRADKNRLFNVTFIGFIPNGSLPMYQARGRYPAHAIQRIDHGLQRNWQTRLL